MAVPARISLITIGVHDLNLMTRFYESLGWERSRASSDEVSFFATADSALALFPLQLLAEDANLHASVLPAFKGVTLAINVESEAEVERVLAEAHAAGATVLKPGQRATWGGYTAFFADPEGNAWEVAHNPGFPLQPDGSIKLPAPP
jgi:uncharacterized protein